MVALREPPPLFAEPFQAAVMPGKGLHGYWRRPDNGWITVAAAFMPNREHYESKGMVYLSQYGQFKPGGPEDTVGPDVDDKGNPWNPAAEPWKRILQRGGAKEFPLEQIIAFRWHVAPPYKGIDFPQLHGADITDYQCPECDRGVYSSQNPQEAARLLRVHLTSGINDQHRYRIEDLSALGRECGIDFGARRVGRRPVVASALSMPEEPDLEPGTLRVLADFKCDWCDWAPLATNKSPANARRFHTKHCKAKRAE